MMKCEHKWRRLSYREIQEGMICGEIVCVKCGKIGFEDVKLPHQIEGGV